MKATALKTYRLSEACRQELAGRIIDAITDTVNTVRDGADFAEFDGSVFDDEVFDYESRIGDIVTADFYFGLCADGAFNFKVEGVSVEVYHTRRYTTRYRMDADALDATAREAIREMIAEYQANGELNAKL
ncbi:MAG: hypothetical protein LIP02_04185 [Bacteroidales bacterium]|nr:hypothetical protein [Bacteroidales bacterium]